MTKQLIIYNVLYGISSLAIGGVGSYFGVIAAMHHLQGKIQVAAFCLVPIAIGVILWLWGKLTESLYAKWSK